MNRCCSPIPPALSRKPGLTFNAGLRRHYHRPKRVECGQKPAYRHRYGDLFQMGGRADDSGRLDDHRLRCRCPDFADALLDPPRLS